MFNFVFDSCIDRILTMSDKSELKAELERKKQRLAQIREEKKRKEEERKKKEVRILFSNYTYRIICLHAKTS